MTKRNVKGSVKKGTSKVAASKPKPKSSAVKKLTKPKAAKVAAPKHKAVKAVASKHKVVKEIASKQKPVATLAKKEALKTKPPKNLTPEMLQIRARLIGLLRDLRSDIDHEVRGASDRDLAHINDTSDMASDSAEGDLALRIAESETVQASEVERAIDKIDNGTYGCCEVCNKVIGSERLLYLPYVTLCIGCQALSEIRKRKEGDELDDLADEPSEGDSDSN